MRRFFLYLFFGIFLWAGCGNVQDNHEVALPSPDFDVHLYFNLFNGNPYYMVYYRNQIVIKWSLLGFRPDGGFPLNKKMMLAEGDMHQDPTNGMVVDTSLFFNNIKFNSLSVPLVSSVDTSLGFSIDFRSFKGGIAFRYAFDKGSDRKNLIPWETSEINFNEDSIKWRVLTLSDTLRNSPLYFDTPVELTSDTGYQVSIFEDANPDFSGIELKQEDQQRHRFNIVSRENSTAYPGLEGRVSTPWRIILISKTKTDE